MLKVGITGGIGSGKTTVCQVFETLGIPVFYADAAAKYLMNNDPLLIKKITELFGESAYIDQQLDRSYISSKAFTNPELLKQLNAVVHPATINYGDKWMKERTTPYVLKEAAIFFESGTYKQMDLIIGVYANKETRLQRVMQRSDMTKEEVEERMAQQMNEEEKMKRCDYVINNNDHDTIIPQVLQLHEELLKKAK